MHLKKKGNNQKKGTELIKKIELLKGKEYAI